MVSFISVFLVVYVIYLVTVILNKNKIKKFKNSNQALYFIRKYKLKITDDNVKWFANLIALANSFIIALAFAVTEFVSNFILKLLVAFLVLFPMILISYHLVAKIFKKKEGK